MCCFAFLKMADNETVAKRRYFCGHCLKELSKTRFFQHRRLFYNKKASQQRVFETRLGDDFHFSDSEVDSKLHRVCGH